MLNKVSLELLKSQQTCDVHGPYEVQVITGTKWTPPCPKCAPAVEPVQYEVDKAKHENALRQRIGIPLRFGACRLDNYTAKTKAAETALRVAKRYVAQFDVILPFGTSMIFSGKVGTGKTHLACAIVRALADRQLQVRYVTLLRLMESVKNTFGTTSEDTAAAYKEYIDPVLLVIDEIGIQYGSEAEQVILYRILNARYEQLRPTIICSNLDWNGLTNCIGEPLCDRLRENGGQFVVFDWESRRNTVPDELLQASKKAPKE